MTVRVGVIGAAGRLGSALASGVAATEDLQLVAAISPSHAGRPLRSVVPTVTGPAADLVVSASLDALVAADVEVALEATRPATVGAHLRWLLEHDIHAVVGATGLSEEDLEEARRLAARGTARALIAPNFSIGAVLLERFAAQAARYFPHVEIIELHHDKKLDAPSGTAVATAAAIARARGDDAPAPAGRDGQSVTPGSRGSLHHGVPVHAVRLPGLLAHEEVLFGGDGQFLTLRHDTTGQHAFVEGALVACRSVAALDGVVVGLGEIL